MPVLSTPHDEINYTSMYNKELPLFKGFIENQNLFYGVYKTKLFKHIDSILCI